MTIVRKVNQMKDLGGCFTTIVGHLIILVNRTLSWRFGVCLFVFMENHGIAGEFGGTILGC